ncbi:DUF4282 domain-containing protein [Neisseria sp. Dent CA1/247]|uniref:DUF4282 domain-containing protein n=1 Tax=Neisseria sp. Dent CA1/247 TaxID=2912675 RepID=UPI001FD58F5B|nr:DUF4282 domain-containing protein [Neisseria sp. Dent CA1/247]UOO77922.1 DUF4282 domain-containing protein [Neisseria sp. Dent CA1/247]
MKSILFLDSVLSTKIITLIYWLLLFLNNIGAVLFLIMGFSESASTRSMGGSGIAVLAGLAALIFGNLIIRLWAEFTVVIFKIQQNTYKASENTRMILEQQRD